MKNLSPRSFILPTIFSVTVFWASSSSARAQSELSPKTAIEVDASIGLTSDYRFRGISLSDRKPAVQGGIELSIPEGLFAGVWASSIAEYGDAKSEIDVYAGYARTIAGIDMSVGSYAYIYPGGAGVDYVEFQTSLGKSFGKVTANAEFAYAPNQKNTATDNIYAGVTVSRQIGNSPVQLKLRGGYEHGYYDGKWDWEGGLLLAQGSMTATFGIVGSNYGSTSRAGRLAGTGLVAGLTFDF